MTTVQMFKDLSDLERAIEDHIQMSKGLFNNLFNEPTGECYVIKYLHAKRLSAFIAAGQLYASDVPGYTWGDGVYVAPLAMPFSTMMYGRVGIVGKISPTRVYDAA